METIKETVVIKKSSRFVRELREFAIKGSVVDLAVGVIIGGAFGKIVTSLVTDIINPLLGILLGRINLTHWRITLSNETLSTTGESIPITLNIGTFVGECINFLIIAIAIFAMIKIINKMRKNEEGKHPATSVKTEEIELLKEIRDTLKNR